MADAARAGPAPARAVGRSRQQRERSAEASSEKQSPAAGFSIGRISIFPRPPALQLKGGSPEGVAATHGPGGALDVAAAGLGGGGGALPYREELELSLGVSLAGVRAHTDADARSAASRLGARGYASGSHVAFDTATPSMKLVAHEVTHVLQQRRGVHLEGGVGHPNDRYEREAERVGERVEAGLGAWDVGRAYLSAPAVAAGPGIRAPDRPLNGQLREMLRSPARPPTPVQFDLKGDLRLMLEVYGPPHFDGIIQTIRAAPVAERQAAVADSATLDLIRRFRGVWATAIVSSLLEGSQNWANPPATDFYTFFVLNGATGTPPSSVATMNCWESIMYAAWLAGVLSAAWIKNYYVSAGALPGTTVDPTPTLWAQLGFTTSLPTYDPSTGRVPTVGQLVFYVTAGRAIPDHVAVYMGGGEVMSLWTKPRINQVQRISITAISGTLYYGDPPW